MEIKKIGKFIFIHYFITFLGEHSNVNNVINALLCIFFLLLMYRYSWLITFEIFRNFFFWIEGWVGRMYLMQTFLDYYIFFNIYKAP